MSGDAHVLGQEPEPDMVLIRAERRETPPALAALGLTRVRIRMRSGAWRYEAVPVEAIVEPVRSDPAQRSAS